jgi:hypothetical protein
MEAIMKQYKDVIITAVQSVILVLFLIIACFLDNELVKGILLFLFSGVLIGNTIFKLVTRKKEERRSKIFYSILLVIESLLAAGAITVIIMAIF